MNSDTSNFAIHIEANAARIPQLDAGGPALLRSGDGRPTSNAASSGAHRPVGQQAARWHRSRRYRFSAARSGGYLWRHRCRGQLPAPRPPGLRAESKTSAHNTLPTRPPSVLASLSALLDAARGEGEAGRRAAGLARASLHLSGRARRRTRSRAEGGDG